MIVNMKDHGEFLGSRMLGERVRSQIIEMLQAAPGRLVLDFAGVGS